MGLFFFYPKGAEIYGLMFVHVDDAVDAILLSLENENARNEKIIICPDSSLTYLEWINFLCDNLGRKRASKSIFKSSFSPFNHSSALSCTTSLPCKTCFGNSWPNSEFRHSNRILPLFFF